jgi:choline dehydrogenase-like flavoprotein
MLIDAAEFARQTITADVAIVGGGMCGLALARELSLRTSWRIVVLESGGLQRDPTTDALNEGTASIHDPYGSVRRFDDHLSDSRCRVLGGSGQLWGGKCAELDPIDLEPRAWIEGSGWPFDLDQLKPYLDRACAWLEIPTFSSRTVTTSNTQRPPLQVNRGRTLTTGMRRFTALTPRASGNRFDAFVHRCTTAPRVSVLYHATVTQLLIDTKERRVDGVMARLRPRGSLLVRATRVVLAAGGLENARLLLNCHFDPVLRNAGRYFTGHAMFRQLHSQQAVTVFTPSVTCPDLSLYTHKDPAQLQGVLQLTRTTLRREKLPSCSLTLEPPASPGGPLAAWFMCEQRPHRESRVQLASRLDDYDVPRLHLDWRFQRADLEDLGRAVSTFAAELREHGVGELTYAFDPSCIVTHLESARHHMGTTRIHRDSELGVVDEHCRTHALGNLYCVGTSVLPTSGIANPTLTILALTLRLADHLQRQIGEAAAPSAQSILG